MQAACSLTTAVKVRTGSLGRKSLPRYRVKKLWMDAYTAALFEGENASIEVAEDFLQKAGPKEYALLEDREAAPYLDRIEKNCALSLEPVLSR